MSLSQSYIPLATFEVKANKSNSTSLGTSTTLYPTQNAAKAYADSLVANAGNITSGTLDDNRLSSNVALRNVANTFTGAITQAYVATPSGTVGAIIRGLNLTPTLTAGANNQTLTAVEINPTISAGAFTGVTTLALDVKAGSSRFAGALLFATDNTYNIGSNTERAASTYTVNSFVTNLRANTSTGVTFYSSTGTVIATMFNTGNINLGTDTTDQGYPLYVRGLSFHAATATFSTSSGAGVNVISTAGTAPILVSHTNTAVPTLGFTNTVTTGAIGMRFTNDGGVYYQLWGGGSTSTIIANGVLYDHVKGDAVFRISESGKKLKIHSSVSTGASYTFAVNPANGNIESGANKLGNGGYTGVTNNATTPVPTEGAGTLIYDSGNYFGWNGTAWKQITLTP